MKKTRVLLQMILLAVVAEGTSLEAQSVQAPEQTAATSDEKSNSSRAGSNNAQAGGEKDLTNEYSPSHDGQKSFAGVRTGTQKRRPAVGNAKPPQNRQLSSAKMPAAKNLQREAPQNVPDSHAISSTVYSNVPGKTVRHSSPSVPPSTVALNGQQFKNSRDPGARTATSGGAANSTRGTAAINGSDIKRRP
jgi:hypothetical protein